MTTKRVLFVAEAVTLAHVGRMLSLASLLDRSAYTPLLAWHPRFNHLLGELEDEYYPLESISTEQFTERLRTARAVYDFHTMAEYVSWELEIFREASPDLVVGDFRLSLATSARIAGLPYINVINAHWSPYARPRFIVPESPPVRMLGVTLGQRIFDTARPFYFLAYANDFNRLAEKFGRPSFGYDLRKIYCEGDRTLYPDIPELTPTYDLPSTHRYLGPVQWSPELPPPSAERFHGDRPVVYLNMGSSGNAQLLPRLVDALGRLPVQVIAATGGRIRVDSPSPDVHVVDFVSGEGACELADLLVFNGGVGGTQQALSAGIPVIGIPSNLDQYLNMYFVTKAGFGRLVRSDRVSVRSITRAVESVLENERYNRRAVELGESARAYRPADTLREVMDELIAESPPAPKRVIGKVPPPTLPTKRPAVPLEEIREAVHAAVVAPSAANSQPWRYSWNGDRLEILISPQQANPFLEFKNPDTWVALGCVLANLRVAARAQGRRVEVELFPDDSRGGLVARVWMLPGGVADATLVGAMRERCTNRRPHDDRPIPADVREALLATCESDAGDVQIDWFDRPSERDQIAWAASVYFQLLFENPGMLVSLLGWVRWTDAAETRARTGLSLTSLELTGFSKWAIRLAASRWRARLLAPTGLFRLYRRLSARNLQQTTAFGLVSVPAMEDTAFVRAGEAIERLWLVATQHRLALHPLAGLPLLAARCRFADGAGLSAHERRTAEQAVEAAAEVAPSMLERVPVMLFRCGYAPPPATRSLRLPLESVFEYLPETVEREHLPVSAAPAAAAEETAGRYERKTPAKDFRVTPRNRYAAANRSIVESEIRASHTVTVLNEVDMTGVKATRAAYSPASRPPYTAFVVKALARTLEEFPYANRRIYTVPFRFLVGTRYQQFETVDIGVAVERDVPGDAPLAFVDIIRNADQQSLEQITAFLMKLRTADRDNNDQWRKFSTTIESLPSWLASFLIGLPVRSGYLWRRFRGGAALVSSPTKYGIDMLATTWTWPIGVSYGLVKERPYVIDSRVTARPTCFVTLNFDRRVTSGAQAGRFFARLCELLSEPSWMTNLSLWRRSTPGRISYGNARAGDGSDLLDPPITS